MDTRTDHRVKCKFVIWFSWCVHKAVFPEISVFEIFQPDDGGGVVVAVDGSTIWILHYSDVATSDGKVDA